MQNRILKWRNIIRPYQMWPNSNIWGSSGLNIMKERGVKLHFFPTGERLYSHINRKCSLRLFQERVQKWILISLNRQQREGWTKMQVGNIQNALLRIISIQQSSSWKLRSPQPIKTFSAFCRTLRFITAFTTACDLSLSRTRSIQSMPRYQISSRFILILSSSKWSPSLRSPH